MPSNRATTASGERVRRIWTVGHSNRSESEFLAILVSAGIERMADVRRFPGSRRWPHFAEDALRASLGEAGLDYVHLPELGGRRGTPAEDSSNTGWRVASFAAYADYMRSEEFERGLKGLEHLALERRTAMMCSEAVPWRCHRRLIADALLVRGWEVLDIFSEQRVTKHKLTDFARVDDGILTYPG